MSSAKLISYHSIGSNTGTPRVWIENQRLSRLGFVAGTRVSIRHLSANRIALAPADTGLKISSREGTPILDICADSHLGSLRSYATIKATGSYRHLLLAPSIQAFHIARSSVSRSDFRVLELCAGGGTMHTALKQVPLFRVVAAAEFNPKFAEQYGLNAPDTDLIIGDIRKILPSEYPQHDVLVAGFPCTNMSCLGRVKNKLGGRPEAGNQADVFLPIMATAAAHMPRAIVLENVPTIASSHTAMLIRRFLSNLGYHLTEGIYNAHDDFGDIQRRRRWCLIATLQPGFTITPSAASSTGCAGDYLDATDDVRDQADAQRIANTIAGLDRRRTMHAANGNDFRYYTINGKSPEIPTLTRSMAKINQGPFVETKFGLRMPRKSELERISGHCVDSDNYSLASSIIGQGVSVRMFAEIFRQLGEFLRYGRPTAVAFGQLNLFAAHQVD